MSGKNIVFDDKKIRKCELHRNKKAFQKQKSMTLMLIKY